MNKVNYYTRHTGPGYDLHDTLKDVCEQLQPESYLEIGVDGGGSLTTVLTFSTPTRMTLADIWDAKYCDHGLTSHAHVIGLLRNLDYQGKVTYLDGDSKVTLKTLPEDDMYDLILVDGDHSPTGAKADLYAVWPHLNPGGVLIMDDIRHLSYPGLLGIFRNFRNTMGAYEVPQTEGEPSNSGVLVKR